MLKYKYIFVIKYTDAILSNSTGKLLWLEIKRLIAVFLNESIASLIIMFGALFVFYNFFSLGVSAYSLRS